MKVNTDIQIDNETETKKNVRRWESEKCDSKIKWGT